MHVTVLGIEIVFFAVDPLPAYKHFAVRVKIVPFAVQKLPTGYIESARVKIVSNVSDFIETACNVAAVNLILVRIAVPHPAAACRGGSACAGCGA